MIPQPLKICPNLEQKNFKKKHICVVRRWLEVRWKTLILTHSTMGQTSISDHLEPISSLLKRSPENKKVIQKSPGKIPKLFCIFKKRSGGLKVGGFRCPTVGCAIICALRAQRDHWERMAHFFWISDNTPRKKWCLCRYNSKTSDFCWNFFYTYNNNGLSYDDPLGLIRQIFVYTFRKK